MVAYGQKDTITILDQAIEEYKSGDLKAAQIKIDSLVHESDSSQQQTWNLRYYIYRDLSRNENNSYEQKDSLRKIALAAINRMISMDNDSISKSRLHPNIKSILADYYNDANRALLDSNLHLATEAINNFLHFAEYYHLDGMYSKAQLRSVQLVLSQYSAAMVDREQRLREAEQQSHLAFKREKEIEAKAQERQKLMALLISAIILISGLYIFYRLRVSQKQRKIIQSQNQLLEQSNRDIEIKNKEIVDSINYARRIQSAILPPPRLVKEYLLNSFILYKPKDIVAGDFYWMEPTDKGVFFAAADCTGHGVPGAMVSVVCNGGLNRSVREFGLTETGAILDKTRELVIQEFEKSEEEVKDGMDIALCKLSGTVLSYSGANNPLWIVRNGEVLETKADKQPIGKHDSSAAFTTHQIELQKGDSIYIFSDGFPDQFGGEKGKKYKSGNFKKFLISIQDQPMSEQRTILESEFNRWRGDLEQIDDVCVIGVRI